MKIVKESFFPCMENPPRLYLTTAAGLCLSSKSGAPPSLSQRRTAKEEWNLLVQPGTGTVLLESVQKKGEYLCCTEEGELQVSSSGGEDSIEQFWEIHPCTDDQGVDTSGFHVQLISCASKQLLVYMTGTNEAQMSTEEDSPPWRIDFLTGELCYLSNPRADCRVRCDIQGNVNLTSVWKGWEVWRFIEVGNKEFVISSWTHTTHFLTSDASGKVSTTKDRTCPDCRWTIVQTDSNRFGVFVQSVAHKRFLSAPEGSGLPCTTESTDLKQALWDLEPANRRVFHLCSGNTNFLSSKPTGEVCVKAKTKSWEEWEVRPVDGATAGEFHLFSSSHQRYLGSTSSGAIHTVEALQGSEVWQFEEGLQGGQILTSHTYGWQLACNADGSLVGTLEGCHSWELRPKMPSTTSAGQIAAISASGLVAGAVMMTAPYVFVSAVQAIGFGAEGVTAGTFAATMMSAEAIAGGGGVVAGGTVATLQSIGAAGLGATGTAAALGCGAVAGSAVVGTTAALVKGKDQNVSKVVEE